MGVYGGICREYGIRRDLCADALFGVPAVKAVLAEGRIGQRTQLLISDGHAAGQRRGSNSRRRFRADEPHPDSGCCRRLRLLIAALVVNAEYRRADDILPRRGLRVIERFIPLSRHASSVAVDSLAAHKIGDFPACSAHLGEPTGEERISVAHAQSVQGAFA